MPRVSVSRLQACADTPMLGRLQPELIFEEAALQPDTSVCTAFHFSLLRHLFLGEPRQGRLDVDSIMKTGMTQNSRVALT